MRPGVNGFPSDLCDLRQLVGLMRRRPAQASWLEQALLRALAPGRP